MSKGLLFKTRARVLYQLGEQLIKNESIAILELIKNSYDADATKCSVNVYNSLDPPKGLITIEDDGEGMDFTIISTVWLEIGTSHKMDLLSNEKTKRSPKYSRIPLGEKGIGRLGVHKLGCEIEVISKKEDKKECFLKINWDEIDNSLYLEDIPLKAGENATPEYFKNGKTGTIIKIKRFKQQWTKKMARDCYRSVLSLNSPFKNDESFKAEIQFIESTWLDGLLKHDDLEEYKLFDFDITLDGKNISEFEYNFTPWKTMEKLSHRKVVIDDKIISIHKKMIHEKKKNNEIDLSAYRIGPVRFKGIIFDLDSKILSVGVQDKKGLKDYLKFNGGISVFRDNMRVLDYGEPNNDWLDLSGRRINMPAKKLSNNIIIGSVFLDRNFSLDLKEKANREGFIENAAYNELCSALRYSIDRVESLRQTDKGLLRKFYGTTSVNEPVISSIADLQDLINKKVKDDSIKKEMTRYLFRIESDYNNICNNLIKSAGAGLNLIIVIHQMEKIIKNISQMISKNASKETIEGNIQNLANLIDGYSILIKKSDIKERNLKGVIKQSIFNIEFRLLAHNIELNSQFILRNENLDAICSEDHFLNAIMNLLDNSIWWLGYSKVSSPSIFIDISSDYEDYVSVIVADNGPGFSLPTEEIIQPFISDKIGGMGIGLHLVDQIMKSLGGKLLFPENDIFEIPSKYQKGAIIALAFKKRRK